MTLYNAKVGKKKRVNKGDGFCRRKTACPLIPEYAAGLKVPDGLNLRIDTTKYVCAIAASLAIKRSASAKK